MKKFKREILPVITFARIDVKRLFRDKVAIFFVFVFPLIFLLIFGSIFSGDSSVSFRVALINQSSTDFSNKFSEEIKSNEIFDVDEGLSSIDQANEKMRRGQIDATIILPSDFGKVGKTNRPSGEAKIIYDQGNEQAGVALTSIMEAVFKDINKGLVSDEAPFTVVSESTATKGLTRFDYTFSGILGFTLLSLGIFGPTTVFPRLKQRGVLRRYSTTTLKIWQYFVGNVISNAVIGLLAVGLMFVAAFSFFNLNMRGDFFNLGIIIVLGTVLLFGIGLAIGGWAKNENQAAPISQLVVLPMMFLSGVFFPTFIMPEFLQNITKFIPLTAIIDASRYIITEGKTVFELGPQLAVMVVWLVAIYIIAFRVFRWE